MAGQRDQFLAPPVLEIIRNEEITARVRMERTASQEIRQERDDLKEAAEQSLNVIVDLGLDGAIRWVSPSWRTVVGTPLDTVSGTAIGNILVTEEDGTNPFLEAVESMKQDDSKSQIIRFRIKLGPSSVYYKDPTLLAAQKEAEGSDETSVEGEAEDKTITLEGQGIMVFDRASGGNNNHVRISPSPLTERLILTSRIDHVDAATVRQT